MPLASLSPSGGLTYHLRALRWRHRLWAPFRARVAAWLAAWQPPCSELLLLGPSAGYTLDPAFLARFAAIHTVEPDPLARWLLRRRFPGLPLRFLDLQAFDEAGPARLAAGHPAAAILFANLLGQVHDTDATAALAPRLVAALAGRHWASYHDLLSASARPTRPCAGLDRLAADPTALARRLWAGQGIEVADHGTAGLAGGGPSELALWPLTPRRWQLVAWVSHAPAAAEQA